MAQLLNLLIICQALFAVTFAAFYVQKAAPYRNKKVWAHMMPWFETKETSEDGKWGIHWTMANKNPDNIDGTGRREIAAHFYPQDDVYGSGDMAVIERQLNQMKYAGIDGILLDWPGTVKAWDYPKNLANCEAIISQLERMGLEFAIVYEDHNIGMTYDAGFITDKIAAAHGDMRYLAEKYFPMPNYIKFNGIPLLLDFGPQTFQQPSDWEQVFSILNPRPLFYTLWHQMWQAEPNSHGEYAWLWVDFMLGLNNFYKYNTAPSKIGVAYPGFKGYYDLGGWPGPGWQIDHNGHESFRQTWELALNYTDMIQLATWNDWGEGTMVEPSQEFGTGCLNIIQQTLVPQYTPQVFEVIRDLYNKRVTFKNDKNVQLVLDKVSNALADLQPEKAAEMLSTLTELKSSNS